MNGADDTLPLSRYGAIGNGASVALVGDSGIVDWLCLSSLDAPSVFAALVDTRRGGRFAICARDATDRSQRYLERTNVLETTHATPRGALVVTDFMPVDGELWRTYRPEPELHRLVEARGGGVEIEVEWSPRFDYALGRTTIARHGDGYVASNGRDRAVLAGFPPHVEPVVERGPGGDILRATLTLRTGEPFALVMRHGEIEVDARLATSRRRLRETERAWRAWVARGTPTAWAGAHAALVERSALALKLLCYSETGAIVAAATTSLPEAPGGIRNWDYRYAWLRDAGMTVEALLGLGHPEEAHAFIAFAAKVAHIDPPKQPWLQIVYGVRGERILSHACLEHLEGYGGAHPVRVGNTIASRRGHDVYEQMLGAALEYASLGHALDAPIRRFLSRIADVAIDEWKHPDTGIWEMPHTARHYVHSKWATSVALDHAVKLAERHGLEGDVARWRLVRDEIRADVLARGFDAERDRFTLSYDRAELDSANVLMPILGFLPADDPRVRSTLAQSLDELCPEGLCRRYVAHDGLPGHEGAFVACSFWLVEALVLAGDVARARALFDRAAACAGPLGLFSEEFDPRSGTMLGNLPQAFSHVAFVDAAMRLALAEGRDVPVHPDPAGLAEGDAPAPNPATEPRRNRA